MRPRDTEDLSVFSFCFYLPRTNYKNSVLLQNALIIYIIYTINYE